MATASFSGIASGIDTDGLIQATLDAARATKVKPSETKRTELQDQSEALTDFKAKLVALQDTVQAFRVINGGAVEKVATSSDDSVATAVASATLNSGSYSLSVSQLAEPGRVVFPDHTTSNGYEPTDTLFNANGEVTFTFREPLANTSVGIDVTTSTTASQFVNLLNTNQTFSANAEASLVNIGTTSSPEYKIVITAKNTGSGNGGNTISFNSVDANDLVTNTMTGYNPANSETDGKNSQFTIGGISSSTISRPTNDISDVIQGLTFNLKDTGTAKITIGVDTIATTTKIENFIKAYNAVVTFMQDNNTVTREEEGTDVTNTFGPLAKTSIDENFMQLIRAQVSSANSGSGTIIRIFADLGITTDSSAYDSNTKKGGGTLLLNINSSSTLGRNLSTALATEPDSVAKIFESFAEAVGNPTTGVIAQFTNFNRLIDTALNSNSTQISDLNNRISEAEKQLSNQEIMLKQRYARLESLMGSLQSKQASLTSALAGL